MSSILVTGANGQLGMELRKIAGRFAQHQFVFATRAQLPIDNAEMLAGVFSRHKIDYCINAAAYTAVDMAETATEQAFLINAAAAGNLALQCSTNGARFIHISTDYVFDGNGQSPYREDHPTDAVNAYGASKLKGEELVMKNDPDAVIIRTSWLYSFYGNNFVKTMLRLMKEKESISVVSDQSGSPTYAADLAFAIAQIIDNPSWHPGIYHYSNEGITSWYEFALAIKEISGSTCKVNPIPATAWPTPAKRPGYSAMDTNKIRDTYGISIPGWRSSLENCIKLLNG